MRLGPHFAIYSKMEPFSYIMNSAASFTKLLFFQRHLNTHISSATVLSAKITGELMKQGVGGIIYYHALARKMPLSVRDNHAAHKTKST
jgi:hypothetical protein